MARTFQIKRGEKATMPTLAQGEFGFVTDSGAEELHIGNGSQNIQIARQDYVDEAIANIPTPDVSGQINTHNTDATAHEDIREAVTTAESNAKDYTDEQIAAIPTPDVSGQINTHNTSTTAHADIREAIAAKATMTEVNTAIESAIGTAIGGSY